MRIILVGYLYLLDGRYVKVVQASELMAIPCLKLADYRFCFDDLVVQVVNMSF